MRCLSVDERSQLRNGGSTVDDVDLTDDPPTRPSGKLLLKTSLSRLPTAKFFCENIRAFGTQFPSIWLRAHTGATKTDLRRALSFIKTAFRYCLFPFGMTTVAWLSRQLIVESSERLSPWIVSTTWLVVYRKVLFISASPIEWSADSGPYLLGTASLKGFDAGDLPASQLGRVHAFWGLQLFI